MLTTTRTATDAANPRHRMCLNDFYRRFFVSIVFQGFDWPLNPGLTGVNRG
jgi:hypothetical protein